MMEIYEVLKRDCVVQEFKTRKNLFTTLHDHVRAARPIGGLLHAAGRRPGPRPCAQSVRGARQRRADLQRRSELSGRSIGRISGQSGSETLPLWQVAPGQLLETVGTGRIQAELGYFNSSPDLIWIVDTAGYHTC